MSLQERLGSLNLGKAWTPRPEVLLCANTVKPMHGVVPRIILGKEWWDKTRKEAYESTNFHCVACGVCKWDAEEKRWLEGHEIYKINYSKGRQTYVETVPLCHYCHNYIHDGRLRSLVDQGEITREKYDAVMKHGNRVLKAARIKKPYPYDGKMAPWHKWRLILFGKSYPPLYKSFAEWEKHFHGEDD